MSERKKINKQVIPEPVQRPTPFLLTTRNSRLNMKASTIAATVAAVAALAAVQANAQKDEVSKSFEAIPWAGDYNGIVGCNTQNCCCPKNYFHMAEPVPLTLTLIGEMEGVCGHPAQPFWVGNSTLSSANATTFETNTGLPSGVKYRVTWSPDKDGRDSVIFRSEGCFFQIQKTSD